MTLEELLDSSAEQLEAMTDEQLMEWAKPYLQFTRPDLASDNPLVKRETKVTRNQVDANMRKALEAKMTPEKLARAKAISEQLGLDIFGE